MEFENMVDLMDTYVAYLKVDGFAANTVQAKTNDLGQFVKYLATAGIENMSAVDAQIVTAYVNNMAEEQSALTVDRKLSSVKMFFEWAIGKEKSPVEGIRNPAVAQTKEYYILSA
ncbi:MAG: site-specific integrase, partial [Candidatus Marinimicrobia bacterium]|nr:site-specific integrase [Candidatus Neomarinimicrobiota bacterium]